MIVNGTYEITIDDSTMALQIVVSLTDKSRGVIHNCNNIAQAGSAISNGRGPKSCLGWVFNSKLGHIAILHTKWKAWHAATSRVENLAQGLSC
jgi:hypothetical protein